MNTIRLLQFVVLILGVKELCNAMAYHKQQKKKLVIVSVCVGVLACVCAIISMTGIL